MSLFLWICIIIIDIFIHSPRKWIINNTSFQTLLKELYLAKQFQYFYDDEGKFIFFKSLESQIITRSKYDKSILYYICDLGENEKMSKNILGLFLRLSHNKDALGSDIKGIKPPDSVQRVVKNWFFVELSFQKKSKICHYFCYIS